MEETKESRYVVTFPLKTEKWQEDVLEDMFGYLTKLYNFSVNRFIKEYRRMLQEKYPEYFDILQYYRYRALLSSRSKRYEQAQAIIASGKPTVVKRKNGKKSIITVDKAKKTVADYERAEKHYRTFKKKHLGRFLAVAYKLNDLLASKAKTEQAKSHRVLERNTIAGLTGIFDEHKKKDSTLSDGDKQFDRLCRILLQLIRESTVINEYERKHYSKGSGEYEECTFGGEYGVTGITSCWSGNLTTLGLPPNSYGINSLIMQKSIGKPIWSAFSKKFDFKNISAGESIFLHKKVCGDRVGTAVYVKSSGSFNGLCVDLTENTISIPVNGERSVAKQRRIKMPFLVEDGDPCAGHALRNGVDGIVECRLKRVVMSGKPRYYIGLTFGGLPYDKGFPLGVGVIGVDVGPGTIAVYADGFLKKYNLHDDRWWKEEKFLRGIQKLMSHSEFLSNPGCYDENGKPIKGRRRTNRTKRWLRYSGIKREHNRRYSEYRDSNYNRIAHEIISHGDVVVIEKNDVKEWQESGYGKSILKNAPATFVSALIRMVTARGGKVLVVDTAAAASQFDFTNQVFTKHDVSERSITLSNGKIVDRDLIAAFNLYHINPQTAPICDAETKKRINKKGKKEKTVKSPDFYKVSDMREDFGRFLELHGDVAQQEIDKMEEEFLQSTELSW